MPPPRPSSCLPLGSGDPIAPQKIGDHAARSLGRCSSRKIMARDVPPR